MCERTGIYIRGAKVIFLRVILNVIIVYITAWMVGSACREESSEMYFHQGAQPVMYGNVPSVWSGWKMERCVDVIYARIICNFLWIGENRFGNDFWVSHRYLYKLGWMSRRKRTPPTRGTAPICLPSNFWDHPPAEDRFTPVSGHEPSLHPRTVSAFVRWSEHSAPLSGTRDPQVSIYSFSPRTGTGVLKTADYPENSVFLPRESRGGQTNKSNYRRDKTVF